MDTQRDRRVGTAVAVGLLVLAVGGCHADDASAGGDQVLDRATGAVLADAADRLSAALEAGDACAALDEAAAFEQRARAAVEDELAPSAVIAEAVRVVEVSTNGLACPTDDVTAAEADGAGTSDPVPADAGDADASADAATEEPPAGEEATGASEPPPPRDDAPRAPEAGADDDPPRGPAADRGRTARGPGPGAPGRGEGRGRG